MGGRRMNSLRLQRFALSATVLLSLTACGTPTPSPSSSTAPTLSGTTTPTALFEKLKSGTLYVILGDPGSGAVWRVDLASGRSDQLTHPEPQYGASSLSASRAGLVLADASSGIDVVSVYRAGKSIDLAGHGGPPVISPDGTVAYVQIPDFVNGTGPQSWRIAVMPVAGGQAHTLYEQSGPDLQAVDLSSLAWGPGGRLAAVSAGGPRNGLGTPEVLILNGNGQVETRVRPMVGEVGQVVWNPNAPGVAVAGWSGKNELIGVNGQETALLSDWTPMCWSPSGADLLVTHGLSVGVWHATTPGQVEELGSMPSTMMVGDCSWTDAPAAGA